ncbi:MAG: hypothetical protein AAF802_11130 [Planctomycetota bacterium]
MDVDSPLLDFSRSSTFSTLEINDEKSVPPERLRLTPDVFFAEVASPEDDPCPLSSLLGTESGQPTNDNEVTAAVVASQRRRLQLRVSDDVCFAGHMANTSSGDLI